MFQSGIWILMALLMQTPSLDSASPKERLEAIDAMSLAGKTENVAPLAAALKKEPKSDVRAAIVAGLARIGGPVGTGLCRLCAGLRTAPRQAA